MPAFVVIAASLRFDIHISPWQRTQMALQFPFHWCNIFYPNRKHETSDQGNPTSLDLDEEQTVALQLL